MRQRRVLSVLFGTLLLDMIGYGMVFPILPILFTDPASPSFLLPGYAPGAQFFLAGAVTAVWGLMQFIAAPILGELSDAFGRKRLLVLGVGLLAGSQIIFGLGIGLASVPLLFVARAVAGISAGNLGIAQAAIADVSAPQERARNFGLIGAAFGLGFIIGPLLAGWLVQAWGNPALPFYAAGVLGGLNALLLALLLPETNIRPAARVAFTWTKGLTNLRSAAADKDTRRLYLASFLYLFGFSMFTSFFGIFLVQLFGFSEAQVGTTFAAVGICVAFTQLVILRALARRYAETTLLRYTLVTVGAAIALATFMPNAPLFLAFIPLVAIPHAVAVANLPALISRGVPPEKQGAALGINASLVALANGIAPLVMGGGSGLLGVYAPFLAAALFIGAAWWALFWPARSPQAKKQAMEA